MTATTPGDQSVVALLCAALEPYPWRRFTPHLVARLALAAHDRQGLHDALVAVPGAEVGPWAVLEPVERGDARAARLVALLDGHRWTDLRLPTLCRQLSGHLAA